MTPAFTLIDYDEAADWSLPLSPVIWPAPRKVGPVSRFLEGLGSVLASAILGMVGA